MTAPSAQVLVPAVASLAIRETVTGPRRRGRVLGASPHAVWLHIDREVVVLSSRDATRLANGVHVPLRAAELPFQRVEDGEQAMVGDGRVVLASLVIDVVRWWDPHPSLPIVSRRTLAGRISGFPAAVPGVAAADLRDALVTRSIADVLAAAASMLGRGPGLTPEADDYLTGALAAGRCLAPAVGIRKALAMHDAAEAPLAALAMERTTVFSASLIRHAVRGNVAAPAGALLRSFAGRGDVGAAHRQLLEVGHTSGPALAAGMVLGVHALIEGNDT